MSESFQQTRQHSGGHHHHEDNVYLTSTNKNDAGVRITRVGLFVNLGMAISKGIGGYVFHSQALAADAVHSLTDLVSDFMTLATISWSLKPPTERFPTGYGKIESLGSLGVSSILLIGGTLMGWAALIDLCHTYLPAVAEGMEYLGIAGHGHSHTHIIPNIQAAWIAGGSIVIKEWLYRATLKVAKERKSSVLESNAVHHRVDSLTAIAALVSIAGSNIVPSFRGMDAFGSLLITYLVVRTGWTNTRTSLNELADASMDEEVKERVIKEADRALDDMMWVKSHPNAPVEIRRCQGIKAGQNYSVEIEVACPATWTVEKTRVIEEEVRERVGSRVRGVRRVRVRFVGVKEEGDQGFMDEFISPSVSQRTSPEPESDREFEESDEEDHGHHHSHGSGRENGDGKLRKR
ncbi:hypothetical protein P152DRAFT_455932 [Eremomyces bilateralis CBS 781.70]|uniref:Cation efflux protein transmembrane domain-containing protein n=1 Tax=Eremomyces bilateralis CBS 781.70 TaxID=1392243 RepID=A0A6G1GA42_9PEZI|nr:uncharacterized protein P152DRAFT_455932 [Eremomyces bilateralis CBS 781.70]KAF1814894.1 hypothetical protein P152DRAFT_455932 [Eremomyces bilateralis CBS 781.70]